MAIELVLNRVKQSKNRVADNAPNRGNRIVRDSNRLDEHSINAHTDQDEEALEAQGKEAAQVVLAHLALFMAAEGGKRDGCQD